MAGRQVAGLQVAGLSVVEAQNASTLKPGAKAWVLRGPEGDRLDRLHVTKMFRLTASFLKNVKAVKAVTLFGELSKYSACRNARSLCARRGELCAFFAQNGFSKTCVKVSK